MMGIQEFAAFANSREDAPDGHLEVGRVLAKCCVDRYGERAWEALEGMRKMFLGDESDSGHFKRRACEAARPLLAIPPAIAAEGSVKNHGEGK